MLHTLTSGSIDLLRSLNGPAAYLLFGAIIFSESGLLIFFWLPGDSLLITAGILAGTGHLNVWLLILVGIIAATLGNTVGHAFGRSVGETLHDRPDSRFFKRRHLDQAHEFFEKHGAMTVILSRFTPIVRTFGSIVAGMAGMSKRTFFIYNVIGALAWVPSITLLGYFVGNVVPNVDQYIIPLVVVIALLSFIPAIKHLRKR
jgi:membrane-associated protein